MVRADVDLIGTFPLDKNGCEQVPESREHGIGQRMEDANGQPTVFQTTQTNARICYQEGKKGDKVEESCKR